VEVSIDGYANELRKRIGVGIVLCRRLSLVFGVRIHGEGDGLVSTILVVHSDRPTL